MITVAASVVLISLWSCATTDKSFVLYQGALHDKQEGRFQNAEVKLEQSLEILAQNRNKIQRRDRVQLVKDELNYHLPLAQARYYLENHDPKELETTLKSIEPYLHDHPKRFEYAFQIDQVYTSLHYLKKSIEANARSKVRSIEIMLINYNTEYRSYPKDQAEFKKLISHFLSDEFIIKSYRLMGEGYEAAFLERKLGIVLNLPSGRYAY